MLVHTLKSLWDSQADSNVTWSSLDEQTKLDFAELIAREKCDQKIRASLEALEYLASKLKTANNLAQVRLIEITKLTDEIHSLDEKIRRCQQAIDD